jgi:hypothetical protein
MSEPQRIQLDPYVRVIDEVTDAEGFRMQVGVDYDTVTIGRPGDMLPFRLTQAQAGEFAQLFVSAVWQAGQQKARMEEVVEAEIWCAGNCVKGPGLHLSTGTCRVREPEVVPGG